MSQLRIFDFVEDERSNETQADPDILNRIQSAFPGWEGIGYMKDWEWGKSDDYAAIIRKVINTSGCVLKYIVTDVPVLDTQSVWILNRTGSRNMKNKANDGFGDRSRMTTRFSRLGNETRGDRKAADYESISVSVRRTTIWPPGAQYRYDCEDVSGDAGTVGTVPERGID